MTEIYRDGVRVTSERVPPLGPLPPYEDPTTLTRRDRFAMSALTSATQLAMVAASKGVTWSSPMIAECAYQLADAMEAARNKEGVE